ncbi:MAG: RluA family pseudouridine synthase [Nitrospiraceae bacterium]|nr:RluA family pseudouridine synthase [Nitrospiraceae bacterium]
MTRYTLHKRSHRIRYAAKDLPIVYEDKDIIVVDKPVGLLAVATEREKAHTVLSYLTEYINNGVGRARKRLFVVHRLDRETSGLLIFAKSEEAMHRLKDDWQQNEKIYLAVVHGTLQKKSGVITSHLAEDEDFLMYSTEDGSHGKLARTAYKVIRETKRYSLLEIALLTGRKNQIRVHMADCGHPIVGDSWYGYEEDDREPRMALHARSIAFRHPFSGRRLIFTSDIPPLFVKLVGRIEDQRGAVEGYPGQGSEEHPSPRPSPRANQTRRR